MGFNKAPVARPFARHEERHPASIGAMPGCRSCEKREERKITCAHITETGGEGLKRDGSTRWSRWTQCKSPRAAGLEECKRHARSCGKHRRIYVHHRNCATNNTPPSRCNCDGE